MCKSVFSQKYNSNLRILIDCIFSWFQSSLFHSPTKVADGLCQKSPQKHTDNFSSPETPTRQILIKCWLLKAPPRALRETSNESEMTPIQARNYCNTRYSRTAALPQHRTRAGQLREEKVTPNKGLREELRKEVACEPGFRDRDEEDSR